MEKDTTEDTSKQNMIEMKKFKKITTPFFHSLKASRRERWKGQVKPFYALNLVQAERKLNQTERDGESATQIDKTP